MNFGGRGGGFWRFTVKSTRNRVFLYNVFTITPLRILYSPDSDNREYYNTLLYCIIYMCARSSCYLIVDEGNERLPPRTKIARFQVVIHPLVSTTFAGTQH